MHALNLDPVALVLHGTHLYSLGCLEVTLARPIILKVEGVNPAVLFVLREDNLWQSVLDDRFEESVFGKPGATATAILAARFPGITFHERLANGTVRTVVDCRPPSSKVVPAQPPASIPVPASVVSEFPAQWDIPEPIPEPMPATLLPEVPEDDHVDDFLDNTPALAPVGPEDKEVPF